MTRRKKSGTASSRKSEAFSKNERKTSIFKNNFHQFYQFVNFSCTSSVTICKIICKLHDSLTRYNPPSLLLVPSPQIKDSFAPRRIIMTDGNNTLPRKKTWRILKLGQVRARRENEVLRHERTADENVETKAEPLFLSCRPLRKRSKTTQPGLLKGSSWRLVWISI